MMTKEQEKRLLDLSKSTIVGGDIAAAMAEIRILRDLERAYAQQLGEMARLCDTVCTWALEHSNLEEDSPEVKASAEEIMEYVDAVRPPEGSKNPEWVMHVMGPDDVIDFPSQFAALRAANEHNKAWAKIMTDDSRPNDPYCVAVAVLKEEA